MAIVGNARANVILMVLPATLIRTNSATTISFERGPMICQNLGICPWTHKPNVNTSLEWLTQPPIDYWPQLLWHLESKYTQHLDTL